MQVSLRHVHLHRNLPVGGHDLLQRALGYQAALVQNGDVGPQLLKFGQVVGGIDDGGALLR